MFRHLICRLRGHHRNRFQRQTEQGSEYVCRDCGHLSYTA